MTYKEKIDKIKEQVITIFEKSGFVDALAYIRDLRNCKKIDTVDLRLLQEYLNLFEDKSKMANKKEIKMRIWHMPQVGVKNCTFKVDVKNTDEAALLLNTLWDYDNFQFEKRLKPDFSNTSGLEYWDDEDQEWQEYYDDGIDINEIINEREEATND